MSLNENLSGKLLKIETWTLNEQSGKGTWTLEPAKNIKTCKKFENIEVIVWMWNCWVVGSWQTVSFIPRRNSNKTRQCFHSVAAPVSAVSDQKTPPKMQKKAKHM